MRDDYKLLAEWIENPHYSFDLDCKNSLVEKIYIDIEWLVARMFGAN